METIWEGERWAPIEEFEGIYEVSNMGRVRSVRAHYNTWDGRVLTPVPSSRGYLSVALYRDGKRHFGSVHTLVAKAFCERHNGKPCVNHKNGVITDNRASELEWCTYKENTEHAFRIGLMRPRFGEENFNAILTSDDVEEIRRRYAAGGITQRELGEEFGVNHRTISAIVRRENWK